MTPAVADAIFDDALERSMVEVAQTHLTNRTTVAQVYARRVGGLLARGTPGTDVLALRSQDGGGPLVLACEASLPTGVVDVFTGLADPRLRDLVRSRLGRIHADWEVGCAILARWPGARVTIVRDSCLSRVWRRMASCVGLLRTDLDKAGRRVLAGVRRALVTPPYEVGIAEADGLREASRAVPAIRRFVVARDRLASCLARVDVGAAREAFDDVCLDADAARWLRPLVKALSCMREAIFNAGYCRLPSSVWASVATLSVHVVPGEPGMRAVARHLRRREVEASLRPGCARDPWPGLAHGSRAMAR